jgi:pilus assembly protein Flp/PilA
MNTLVTTLLFQLRVLFQREEGQDLVEYALVVALIGLGCVTGMGYLATGINNAFSEVSSMLGADI